jgi:hypothetical protein
MNKLFHREVAFILGLLFPLLASAQVPEAGLKSYDRLVRENPWLTSENKTGNIFNPFITDGTFTLNAGSQKGDLKLVQQSPDETDYGFKAHKTIRFDNIIFDGGVSYSNQQQEKVGWIGRMNPFTNNPYMLADSIFGLYSKDYVSLFGSLGYRLNDKWAFGLDVDYMVGDGARVKDPRPINNLFNLEVYPSMILSLNGVKIGANLHYLMGREKIDYLAIEHTETYRFFRFFGLGKGAKTVSSWSYHRNYYSSGLGGELQFDYHLGDMNLFSGVGYFSSLEEAEDGSTSPSKGDAGDYKESVMHFYTIWKANKKLLHSARLFANITLGDGSEFLEQPYTQNSITYYRTVAEISKFSLFQFNPGIEYQLAKPVDEYFNKWVLEGSLMLDHQNREYLLEATQTITNIISAFRFERSAFFNSKQLLYGVNGSYSYNLKKEFLQKRAYTSAQEVAAWNNLYYPDYTLLSNPAWSAGARLKYGWEVKLLKDKSSQFFVDLNAQFSYASSKEWTDAKTRELYVLKIGLTY